MNMAASVIGNGAGGVRYSALSVDIKTFIVRCV